MCLCGKKNKIHVNINGGNTLYILNMICRLCGYVSQLINEVVALFFKYRT